jgi:predicted dehydrogenase
VSIRVGFFGAGFISDLHVWFLSECGIDHQIVAVHDPDTDRAEAFAEAHGARAVAEDELLDLVDAVYVCTWTSEHPRLVSLAADAGRAVFCEKPLAFDADAAASMAAAVEAAGVVNQVGLVLRFMPPFRFLRRLLADERAGEILAVVFRDDQYLPVQGQYASVWRGDPTRAGAGTLLEHSIHDVDLLAWLLGPVRAVSATTREVHAIAGIEDVVAARLDFECGTLVTLTSVWHDMLERPSDRHVEVFGERLHVVVEHDLLGPVRWRFAGQDEQCLDFEGLRRAAHDAGDHDDNPATVFLRAVRDGTSAAPDFAAAMPAHRLVDALYASAADDGDVVRRPYDTPPPMARGPVGTPTRPAGGPA